MYVNYIQKINKSAKKGERNFRGGTKSGTNTKKGNKIIFDFMFTKKAPNDFKQSNTKYSTKTITCWGEDTICCWTIWGILVTYKQKGKSLQSRAGHWYHMHTRTHGQLLTCICCAGFCGCPMEVVKNWVLMAGWSGVVAVYTFCCCWPVVWAACCVPSWTEIKREVLKAHLFK